MNRIGYLHSKPTDPEIVTLELSQKEHDELHATKDHTDWVNKHKVFAKDVSKATLAPHLFDIKKGQACQVVGIHELHCSAVLICVPV